MSIKFTCTGSIPLLAAPLLRCRCGVGLRLRLRALAGGDNVAPSPLTVTGEAVFDDDDCCC